MNDEDKIWFNGIYPYFRMLRKINELLLLLMQNNPQMEEQENIFLEITSELLRLLPYKLEYKKDKKEITGIKLLMNDGILLLSKYLNNIESDYNMILKDNFDELVQTIRIRNKYIHEPHNIKCVCFTCGGNNTYAGFEYKEDFLELNTEKLIEIVKKLNDIYKKIEIQFLDKVNELSEIDKNHPYILNMINNYFKDYNSKLNI